MGSASLVAARLAGPWRKQNPSSPEAWRVKNGRYSEIQSKWAIADVVERFQKPAPRVTTKLTKNIEGGEQQMRQFQLYMIILKRFLTCLPKRGRNINPASCKTLTKLQSLNKTAAKVLVPRKARRYHSIASAVLEHISMLCCKVCPSTEYCSWHPQNLSQLTSYNVYSNAHMEFLMQDAIANYMSLNNWNTYVQNS